MVTHKKDRNIFLNVLGDEAFYKFSTNLHIYTVCVKKNNNLIIHHKCLFWAMFESCDEVIQASSENTMTYFPCMLCQMPLTLKAVNAPVHETPVAAI